MLGDFATRWERPGAGRTSVRNAMEAPRIDPAFSAPPRTQGARRPSTSAFPCWINRRGLPGPLACGKDNSPPTLGGSRMTLTGRPRPIADKVGGTLKGPGRVKCEFFRRHCPARAANGGGNSSNNRGRDNWVPDARWHDGPVLRALPVQSAPPRAAIEPPPSSTMGGCPPCSRKNKKRFDVLLHRNDGARKEIFVFGACGLPNPSRRKVQRHAQPSRTRVGGPFGTIFCRLTCSGRYLAMSGLSKDSLTDDGGR